MQQSIIEYISKVDIRSSEQKGFEINNSVLFDVQISNNVAGVNKWTIGILRKALLHFGLEKTNCSGMIAQLRPFVNLTNNTGSIFVLKDSDKKVKFFHVIMGKGRSDIEYMTFQTLTLTKTTSLQ